MKTIWTCAIVATALGASACAGMPSTPPPTATALSAAPDAARAPEPGTTSPVATPGSAPSRGTIARAAELLAAGQEAEAKAELQAVLAATPRDTTAQSFLRQIESDPVKLLGEPSTESYIVQAGDTMSGLADRFLGDSRLFYALSRYNGLASPNALSVGRVLKLPSAAVQQLAKATPARPAAASPADAAKANEVRLKALQLLNTGDVPKAVALLKEAVALDSTDPAIRKDLERAERIQSALTKG